MTTTAQIEVKEAIPGVEVTECLSPICPKCGAEIISRRAPHTAKQAAILRYVIEFEERRNHVPSYAMIAKHVGVKSRATIAKHVRALRRQGFLKTA
jgi:hypothetical protein